MKATKANKNIDAKTIFLFLEAVTLVPVGGGERVAHLDEPGL